MYCHLIQNPSQMKKIVHSLEQSHVQGQLQKQFSLTQDQDYAELQAGPSIAHEVNEQEPAVNEGQEVIANVATTQQNGFNCKSSHAFTIIVTQ